MNFCGAYGLIRQAAAVATTRSAGFDVAGGLMLIAILSDIHGNREALDACLAQAARMRAERYVFLGDLVGYGADPCYVVDTVARRMESGAVALLGNHDEAIAGSCEGFNPDAKAAVEWTRRHLDREQAALLAALPLTWTEGERLFVHANACAPGAWDYVVDALDAERSMRRTRYRMTVCGHTHRPALFHMPPGKPASRFTPVAGAGIPLSHRSPRGRGGPEPAHPAAPRTEALVASARHRGRSCHPPRAGGLRPGACAD